MIGGQTPQLGRHVVNDRTDTPVEARGVRCSSLRTGRVDAVAEVLRMWNPHPVMPAHRAGYGGAWKGWNPSRLPDICR